MRGRTAPRSTLFLPAFWLEMEIGNNNVHENETQRRQLFKGCASFPKLDRHISLSTISHSAH